MNLSSIAPRTGSRKDCQTEFAVGWTTIPPLPRGLESLGKRRKEFGEAEGPPRAERAGASESLGRCEGERSSRRGEGGLSRVHGPNAGVWANGGFP